MVARKPRWSPSRNTLHSTTTMSDTSLPVIGGEEIRLATLAKDDPGLLYLALGLLFRFDP